MGPVQVMGVGKVTRLEPQDGGITAGIKERGSEDTACFRFFHVIPCATSGLCQQ